MTTLAPFPDITASISQSAPPTSAVPFTRLLRVEWFKTIDTRVSRWLLGLVALASVGMMLAPLIAVDDFQQTMNDYLSFSAFAVDLLLPVVAALVITSEWGQRTVLTTFTQEPRRQRVIFAKMGAIAGITLIAAAFAAVASVIALAVSSGFGRDVDWHLSPSVAIGFVIGIFLNIAIGVGFGVLLQNTAVAIVAIFALPTLFGLLALPLHSAGQWIDPNHALGWVAAGEWDGHLLKITVLVLFWIVVPITAGIARTVRREIS